MSERFIRTQMLLGEEAMEKLKRAKVAVCGIGGVGGYVCEGAGEERNREFHAR